ncbi:LOW QUALITY PROTEIN: mis18-binding protein 1 [Hippoglossus stenolepis]|uniref:LOW QUALITY PROTEIN: mis18-binding protein 1 n=1 Tax=Hippoglossus stenolepis TaxID=195615 RepID=UPI001FAFC73F|nr:LOW QUALITY PROTEIN: mis18-binding protein 1 [Hippoglossus stenolepis]
MASFHHLLQHKTPRFESPAKVFAKLKSKVQREAMYATEPPCNVREKHGGEFSREENFRLAEELKENHTHGFYRSEVQALTLSPISTPQKNFGYSFSNDGIPPVAETGHAFMFRNEHTPTKRGFLESTAVSHSLTRGPRDPPQISDGFTVSSRTPAKTQPVEDRCVRGVYEEDPRRSFMSPAKMLSPQGKRLRKRKWEQQEFNKVSSRKEVGAAVRSQTDTRREDEGDVRGFPAEVNQGTRAPLFPTPRSMAMKRACVVMMEKYPPMSPAKLFAYMKERENKREHRKVHKVSSSTRELFSTNFYQAGDSPLHASHNMDEIEDTGFTRVPESTVPDSCSRDESADSQSDPTEDVPIPAATPQPVLLEDPLVLNSPKIFIPKKNQAVFKCNKWPQRTQFPNESVIYLKKWFLRNSQKGLFLDGIHTKDNVPWNSNIIVDRVSNSVVKTVSGRVYVLVGKMNFTVNSGFPKWFMKKFVSGFPPNWKSLYEKSEEAERTSEGKSIIANTKSTASFNQSAKRNRQKNFQTPESCPPAISSSSSTRTSQSGRVIRSPLEYWRGGRVILDAHMNVTIHECYDTSICLPEVTTTVSARKSQTPARVFLPCTEGDKNQSETSCDEEAPAPARKVKAPLRKSKRAKKPSNPAEPSVEARSNPEGWTGRTRSQSRSPPTDKPVYVDTVPQKQNKPEKAATQRPKNRHVTSRPSERRRKRTLASSPESPTVHEETSQPQLSGDDFSTKRKKEGKGVYVKSGSKGRNKSQPSRGSQSLQSSESSEESGEEWRKRGTATKNSKTAQTKPKQSKCTKISPPTKPMPKPTHSSRTHKRNKGSTVVPPPEQNEDEWTEAELMKLQEAVSYYPKHMSGYWAKVAKMVGARSAEECHSQHTSQGTSQTPAKKDKKPRKGKVEAPKDPVTDCPIISARVGTLRRKQQVRQFLEAMPREDVEDVFSSTYMQNKRFEIPSMCQSEDHEFTMSDLEPLTPMSRVYPEVKTPQCLHITPGMMGSPDKDNDDKYVYQLQKRMKKNQFNVCKQAQSSKNFTPTASTKRTMRRCGNTENDTFVVWEMFPGNNVGPSDSGEEEDFYFSDSN